MVSIRYNSNCNRSSRQQQGQPRQSLPPQQAQSKSPPAAAAASMTLADARKHTAGNLLCEWCDVCAWNAAIRISSSNGFDQPYCACVRVLVSMPSSLWLCVWMRARMLARAAATSPRHLKHNNEANLEKARQRILLSVAGQYSYHSRDYARTDIEVAVGVEGGAIHPLVRPRRRAPRFHGVHVASRQRRDLVVACHVVVVIVGIVVVAVIIIVVVVVVETSSSAPAAQATSRRRMGITAAQ